MTKKAYNTRDKQARCSECFKFMPWCRSKQVVESDGKEEPSPVLVEIGMCKKCEERITVELRYMNNQLV